MSGKLYGVGVGPGDPELLTLKAVRIMKESDILAIPVSDKNYANIIYENIVSKNFSPNFTSSNTNNHSTTNDTNNTKNPYDINDANHTNDRTKVKPCPSFELLKSLEKYRDSCISYQIAITAVKELEQKEILYLPMPMTKDKELLKACHEYGISLIKDKLDLNQTISFLTLGDPCVYSTYLYIHKRAIKFGYEAELINGVPSFCAVSARLNMGLVENSEELHVIPASYQIEESLSLKGTKVLMKTGKNVLKVKEILSKQVSNSKDNSGPSTSHSIKVVENCGMKNEKVYESIDEIGDTLSYYSMIILKED